MRSLHASFTVRSALLKFEIHLSRLFRLSLSGRSIPFFSTGQTFSWLLNITGILALVQWVAIACINLRFRWAFKQQGRDQSDLPFKAPFFPLLNILAIILGCLMFAANGW